MRPITKSDFKDLFKYEENDRDKKELKRDFKKIEKKFKQPLQFTDLIDFYLKSSQVFEKSLQSISVKKILAGLHTDQMGLFNENILRILCVSKAINKMQKELNVLVELKEHLIEKLENIQTSNKLANFINQMRSANQEPIGLQQRNQYDRQMKQGS